MSSGHTSQWFDPKMMHRVQTSHIVGNIAPDLLEAQISAIRKLKALADPAPSQSL
jgi:hypothetical protein